MSEPRARLGAWLPAVAAIVPLLLAGGRAISGSWYPIGDNAFFALRARDVLTDHHPLLGTWTSASLTVGTRINNPGPLLFDLLAGPAKVDVAAGTVVAVVALHVASVVLGVHWARRVAGASGAWAMAGAFLGLQWAMGSEILVEPWQPHSLLLPFLTFLVLVWALVAGQAGALPWAAGVASLILQTHLSYALLVPVLAGLGAGVLVVAGIRSEGRAEVWRRLHRPLLVTAVVLAVAWAQPVVDQVAGEGNLATVATNGAGGGEVAGPRFAARVLASVAAVPGGWGPGGFEGLHVDLAADRPVGQAPELEGLADSGTAVPWALGAGALFAAATWLAWRDRDRPWGSALGVAGVALAAAFASVVLLPVSDLLGIAAHQLRPVWPVVLFATAVVVTRLVRRLPRTQLVPPVLVGALLVLALPAHSPRTGPSADAWAIPIVRDLVAQMDELDGSGIVLVDLSVIRFAEPYSTPVMLELQRRGVEFVVDDDIAVGQLGPSRAREPGDSIVRELRIVDGNAALQPEPGWERIAFVAGLDAEDQIQLDALEARAAAGGALDEASELRRRELDHQRLFESAAVLVRDLP